MVLVLVNVEPFECFTLGVALSYDVVVDFNDPLNEWRGSVVEGFSAVKRGFAEGLDVLHGKISV